MRSTMTRSLLGSALTIGLLAGATAASAATLFQDNFNRGVGSFVGNGWVENHTSEVDLFTRGYGDQVMRLKENPAGEVTATQNDIDLTGYENIVLWFDYKPWETEAGDILEVYFGDLVYSVSLDGAWNWTNVSLALDVKDVAGLDLIFKLVSKDNSYSYSECTKTDRWGRCTKWKTHSWDDYEDWVKIDNVLITGDLIPPPPPIDTPEPAALALFGLGLAGLRAARRRKAK
ncbi:PEP-CTERM sorting domain-containing protein [Sphingosinicella microcystinivorans]|uniref:Secreted protein with PEP-CTERM sorting signal/MYXO-CTERM domain-containing protein n=1 Tax=Sphingosinicella microcystinivorans TaxID=335406 RepID=A0AAD1G2B5_SPHMI|nr:PEP-CTERM sorting domain-containing protein [Sphingosinicella microcystinivorans]RKS87889.1 putative secreted protein with PEP-CTERM sorting signal/MYXO-CTERM domain-containing protein [Sphingosinicella microcystinivorans]BBE35698.1 hypothetical protein SmB9_33560 [Sphingosinicella microcystinivorans]